MQIISQTIPPSPNGFARVRLPRSSPRGGGEIGEGPVRLDFVHPLTKEVTTIRGPAGKTIAELLAIAGVRHRHRRWGGGKCWIEDSERRREPMPIAREHFGRVRPKAGTITTVMLWPAGGGGGGKDTLRVILGIVVLIVAIAASYFVGPALTPLIGQAFAMIAGTVTAAAIPTLGRLAVNVLNAPKGRAIENLGGPK